MKNKMNGFRCVLLVIVSLALTFSLCSCWPPSAGDPFSAGLGKFYLQDDGSIKAGQEFGIAVSVHTHYKLENIAVKFYLPKEVVVIKRSSIVNKSLSAESSKIVNDMYLRSASDWEQWEEPIRIETISQPENFAKGAVHDHKLKWTGNIKQTFFTRLFSLPTVQRCDLWFASTTNWEKWSKPIEIHIRLHFRLSRPRVPFPESTYKKTITWSHKGYSDPGWEIIPDKPNSKMKYREPLVESH